ncbi:MAG: DUF488 family protein [Bacteroidales bacterium]
MKETTIYSIGYGRKNIAIFIAELKAFQIEYLLDIRSKPFSKWNSQFNQSVLKFEVESNRIKYVFVGDLLGGLPDDRSCYDFNGKIVYDLLKEKDFFKIGLNRLITANENAIRVALMCSESKPEECHRSKLIGQELLKENISMKHIVSDRRSKSQEEAMNELTKGKGVVDLFGNEIEFKSKKSY